mmetsp:Transcript_64284/g.149549  ORF Transcript_64284/g.149549 Transcript_64284/m.149549 type:complete len:239 (+) Transcript_64284:288-1004(+)
MARRALSAETLGVCTKPRVLKARTSKPNHKRMPSRLRGQSLTRWLHPPRTIAEPRTNGEVAWKRLVTDLTHSGAALLSLTGRGLLARSSPSTCIDISTCKLLERLPPAATAAASLPCTGSYPLATDTAWPKLSTPPACALRWAAVRAAASRNNDSASVWRLSTCMYQQATATSNSERLMVPSAATPTCSMTCSTSSMATSIPPFIAVRRLCRPPGSNWLEAPVSNSAKSRRAQPSRWR